MIENINYNELNISKSKRESGVYIFKSNENIIYIGSSICLYERLVNYKTAIRNGVKGKRQNLINYLRDNPFETIIIKTKDYRELEEKLVNKHNPVFNLIKVNKYTSNKERQSKEERRRLSAERTKRYYQKKMQQEEFRIKFNNQKREWRLNHQEYYKNYKELHKEETKNYNKNYRELHKEEIRNYLKRKCLYNNKEITFGSLKKKIGSKEASKYIIKEENK